jgi:hypothetical protein
VVVVLLPEASTGPVAAGAVAFLLSTGNGRIRICMYNVHLQSFVIIMIVLSKGNQPEIGLLSSIKSLKLSRLSACSYGVDPQASTRHWLHTSCRSTPPLHS